MTKGQYTHGVDRFSRKWWANTLHDVFWVAVVTVLVWIYADVEFTREMKFSATIHLVTTKASNIELLDRRDIPVEFRVRGNSRLLNRFQRELNAVNATYVYDVSEDKLGPGRHVISMTEILKRSAGIEQAGLTLRWVSRNSVPVHLDRILAKVLPVRFNYTGAALDGIEELTPPTVTVRAPQTVWDKIIAKEPSAALTTAPVDLTDDPTGVVIRREFRIVETLTGFPIELETKTVTVKFRIKEHSGTEKIPVAVRVLPPLAWYDDGTWADYELKRQYPDEWLAKITVTGPRKDLDQLLNRQKEIDAYVPLSDDDKKPVSWLKREVVIRLPADLQVELAGPRPTVHFKLVKRMAATPTP